MKYCVGIPLLYNVGGPTKVHFRGYIDRMTKIPGVPQYCPHIRSPRLNRVIGGWVLIGFGMVAKIPI
jgi:hypothetical protein